jgi:class 3 adenylate cyclase
LSQQLTSEALNTLVERYFSTFLDCIQEAGGDINETAGDSFMAIFHDANIHLHARKAAHAALALLAATTALNRDNRDQPLAIHLGINSGLALVGSTRFEALRGPRWTFTASGPMTNLAARLGAAAASGTILVGPETAQRIDAGFVIEPLGPQALKNLEAVAVYRLVRVK